MGRWNYIVIIWFYSVLRDFIWIIKKDSEKVFLYIQSILFLLYFLYTFSEGILLLCLKLNWKIQQIFLRVYKDIKKSLWKENNSSLDYILKYWVDYFDDDVELAWKKFIGIA